MTMVLSLALGARRSAPSRSAVDVRMDFGRVGTQVDMPSLPSKMSWARAAWAFAQDEMEAGQCYRIDENADVPDDGKDYYFCATPSPDAKMTCEEMPEWMGELEDGTKVYICTVPKV